MAFLVPCPNCGERSVYEFRCAGEVTTRPGPDAPHGELTAYLYARKNVAGEQREWWYHKFGCRRWFIGVRDTVTNEVLRTGWPEEAVG
jgi:sarcosine oxidase subunit delta